MSRHQIDISHVISVLSVCKESAPITVLPIESDVALVGVQFEAQGVERGGKWGLTDEPYQQTVEDNGQYALVQEELITFARLVVQWHHERGVTSSLSEMILCPSYLKIIGMGEAAIPLILAQMKEEKDDPDHWSAALEAITGVDPVPEEAYGDTVKMAEAWFAWAEENNAWRSVA